MMSKEQSLRWLVLVFLFTFSTAAHAQENCYDTVRLVSLLTFAEIECREDFGASKVAHSIQSCATVLPEAEFDRITREADDEFRARTLKDGLPLICSTTRKSIGR